METLDLTTLGYKVNSREDLKYYVPAAFSPVAHPERTDRYSHFSTEKFLDAFAALGWFPYSAKQHGANQFSRHIIRFNNDDFGIIDVNGDKIKPQLILDNSHDGYTPAQIHLGLFKMVGENGYAIAIPGFKNTVKFRHVGVNQSEMMEVIAETAEQYRKVGEHITALQNVIVSEDQKREFAMRALAIRDPHRFLTEDKKVDETAIHAALELEDIYEPIRPQDETNDLWTLFSIVQERTVKGLYEAKSKSGRKANPRPITNAARHLEYNQKVWALAEEFKNSLNEEEGFQVYTTVKGESKLVQVLATLPNGMVQVKDIESNRVFVGSSERISEPAQA